MRIEAWAYTTPTGKIIVNSISDSLDVLRLRGGEGKPTKVFITKKKPNDG